MTRLHFALVATWLLELTIVLPAAASMGFSIWNLTHIQRDKSVEAAIQRDFQHVLKIAERKSWHQANDLITVPKGIQIPTMARKSRPRSRTSCGIGGPMNVAT